MTRLATPLSFTAISMLVIYPRVRGTASVPHPITNPFLFQTTRNIVAKAGGQPILDGISSVSTATSDAFEGTVNGVFDGLKSGRQSLSSLVDKTENAVAEGVKEVSKAAENAPETLSKVLQKAEEAVESTIQAAEVKIKHALDLDHKFEKPPMEFEGGADLNTRGPESYVSLEVDSADTPSGKSPKSVVSDAIEKVEDVVDEVVRKFEDVVEDVTTRLKKSMDHQVDKPPAEFAGGADLHTRGPESYVSLEVDSADKPSEKSPPSAIGDFVKKAEEAIEDAVDSVKKALDHPIQKPPKEFEGGADLNTRGPESYVSLEVDSADKPSGVSPPSVVGDFVKKAEEAIEDAVQAGKKALDHPVQKPPADFAGGADLNTRGPSSYASLEVDSADTPKGKSPSTWIDEAMAKAKERFEKAQETVKEMLDSKPKDK